jgi:hypothetical protein
MLHQVVPGPAQDGSRHLTLHRDTEQPPPPPRQTRMQTDAHTLRQPPASLMQKLWDERHSIRAPSAEHLGTQAVQLAEAAFLDFVVSKQVVTNSSIQECAILGRAAGPGKACSSDWAKAGSPRATDRPVTKRSRRRASLGSTGTCVSRSIRSTFLFGTWPPASWNTCLQAATTHLCRAQCRPVRPQAVLWWPCGSIALPHPSQCSLAPPVAKPSRRRRAQRNSGLLKRSASVEGMVASQAPACGPEQERKRARPGRGPCRVVPARATRRDSCSAFSNTLLARPCHPRRSSSGPASSPSSSGGRTPPHSKSQDGMASKP